ncbi:TPA: MATE family efflux transporter [Streptococcus pyogenes]|uniref:Multidrug export protein MepA n=1 Tax=Peptoniphilus gorbachii TaxID=411567 RepID=A0A6N3DRG5_9FIRM|nr:MATE family efflux transporter [Streptococcus agalactiae]EPV42555.1 multidrug transporter MatE [Streptococcus agalactiae GB00893]KXA50320.1 MATE efflux family protein [Streptococcus agalactiae]HEN2324821.1 MATE family efflux transporter [Streptococcus agalactiae]HEN2448416.1 MATE family efflux transporter [Streptococcus agalactiae]HEN2466890.1 MATE family efflux transporter [Streptococcus agalactiae]
MNESRIKILKEENINTALFKLGMPMVISLLVAALYNVVDTYFVSGLGKEAVAAVSVAFPIQLIFLGIGLTFGAGAGSYISRLLGGNNKKEASIVATVALLTSAILGIVTAIVLFCYLDGVLKFMGAIPSIIEISKSYTGIFIVGGILGAINVTVGNLAVAQGAAKISLKAMILGSISNMILDPIFIFGLNLGVRGAAIATLIARVITSLMYLIYFVGDKNLIEIKLPNFKPTVAIYKEILKIGISMLILQILQTISISKISYAASFYGEEAIAAMGIVLRIVTLGTNVVFGYMKGLQPLAGFNYGAKNYERVREAIKASVKWTNVFCVVWTVMVYIFAPSILSIFGTDENVLNIAVLALRAAVIMFITFGFQFTYSTLYLSTGKALGGVFLNSLRQGIVFIPIILLLPKLMGLNGVIYAQTISDLITTIITIPFAISIHKKLRLAIKNNL